MRPRVRENRSIREKLNYSTNYTCIYLNRYLSTGVEGCKHDVGRQNNLKYPLVYIKLSLIYNFVPLPGLWNCPLLGNRAKGKKI